MTDYPFRQHVLRAVKAVHGQSELGRRIGLSQPSVKYLCEEAKTIRAEIALKIEEATNGEVTRHDLRPDIFGPAPEVAA